MVVCAYVSMRAQFKAVSRPKKYQESVNLLPDWWLPLRCCCEGRTRNHDVTCVQRLRIWLWYYVNDCLRLRAESFLQFLSNVYIDMYMHLGYVHIMNQVCFNLQITIMCHIVNAFSFDNPYMTILMLPYNTHSKKLLHNSTVLQYGSDPVAQPQHQRHSNCAYCLQPRYGHNCVSCRTCEINYCADMQYALLRIRSLRCPIHRQRVAIAYVRVVENTMRLALVSTPR